jgi:hypothetical protein
MTAPAATLAPGRERPGTPTLPADAALAEILNRAARVDYDRWLAAAASAHGCSHPVRLRGQITDIHPATGEITRRLDTTDLPDGVIYKPCGTRRADLCPACAETYRADTYQLIRAGLTGGKGIPETVAAHPCVFATFTAPTFGLVHARITGPDGRIRRCRPRRKAVHCPHGRPASCGQRHHETDACLGKPLCPDCYDYAAAVVWNAHAPELWRRTTIALRRQVARLARLHGAAVSVSYAKVAEFQARGTIHFHAIIRLDGRDPSAVTPPSSVLTAAHLEEALRQAAVSTWFATVSHPVRPRGWDITWGSQLDIRTVHASSADAELTGAAVAGYLAKYATKATEPIGMPPARLTAANYGTYAASNSHQGRLIAACWRLGGHEHPDFAALRRWAHMLGYRGHFSTRSRRYSVTMTAIRAERTAWQRRRHRDARPATEPESVTITTLTWAGIGWQTTGDAYLALSAAARAREHQQAARDAAAA